MPAATLGATMDYGVSASAGAEHVLRRFQELGCDRDVRAELVEDSSRLLGTQACAHPGGRRALNPRRRRRMNDGGPGRRRMSSRSRAWSMRRISAGSTPETTARETAHHP